ncbi:MAG TPA: hypothetical protein VM889_06900 [Candidatus Thermoplasmatota archaeon]|nr:hypothetical protein [Candidatus Thermoplasmatota archaeon]
MPRRKPSSVSPSGERFLNEAGAEDVTLDDEGSRGPTGNAETSADNSLMSEDLAFRSNPPDATARTYEMQRKRGHDTAKDDVTVTGSAMPRTRGHRGGHPLTGAAEEEAREAAAWRRKKGLE